MCMCVCMDVIDVKNADTSMTKRQSRHQWRSGDTLCASPCFPLCLSAVSLMFFGMCIRLVGSGASKDSLSLILIFHSNPWIRDVLL